MKPIGKACLVFVALFLVLLTCPSSAQYPTNCQDVCPWTICPDAANTYCYYFGSWITCQDYGDCIPVAGGLTAQASAR